jgi:biotin/methionine sulfoxide reductase
VSEEPVESDSSFPTSTHWGNYDVLTRHGRVTEIHPAPQDDDPSPIGLGMVAALTDKVRIQRPAVRLGWLKDGPRQRGNRRGAEPFVEVSWKQALDLAAAELERVKVEHGNEAIYGGSYGWGSAGRFHHAQSQIHRFLSMNGGYTDTVNTYSSAALEVILPHVIGGDSSAIYSAIPTYAEIQSHTELVVAFGGLPLKNTQVNTGGVGAHAARACLEECAARGVEFVNVGPLRDDLPEFVDSRWVSPRPNADVALMLGLAYVLVDSNRHDRFFLERCCEGWAQFAAYLSGADDGKAKTAEWAAEIAEVPAALIESLAHEIADKRTLVTASWSIQRARHGEQPPWMALTLAAMSGSMGRPGGGFATGIGTESIGVQPDRHRIAAFPKPPNAVKSRLPVARVSDALLNPGGRVDYDGQSLRYPDTRLVYWCGGNPFHHHQDLNRLVEAWQRPETIIVNDAWWTSNARHADIVFPVATFLERNDFSAGWHDSWLSAMHKATEPPGEARIDYDVFAELAERLGFGSRFTEDRSADDWVRHLYDTTREMLADSGVAAPKFDDFWQMKRFEMPTPAPSPSIDFAALRHDADRYPLQTPSGKIEIYSERIASFNYEDCPGHPTWLEPVEWLGATLTARFPLHLISNQPRTRLHSQFDNGSYSREAKIAGREPIALHPIDAAARGVDSGDVVRVFNDRGACLAGAVVHEGVRPGVVAMATGAWYDPEDPGRRGSLDVHGNPNVLTLDVGTSRLAQGPSAQTCLVELERWDAPLPPVTVFDPPVLLDEKSIGQERLDA